ncbi:MAG: hypothetical protein LBF95_10965, partial [Treponema sp.]|nr:hypothetical protein [Treponema sp.]
GTKFIWGVVPKLDSLVTGLTAALDGQITGIGVTDGLGTKTGFKVGYAAGGLSGSIGAALETFPKEKVKALGVYIDPAISYVVTPWFTPSLEANVTIYSYEDDAKTYYKTTLATGDDLAAFDKFSLTLVTTFTLGNGITIAPRYGLVSKSANAPSIIEDSKIKLADWDEGRIEHRVEIRFGYSF